MKKVIISSLCAKHLKVTTPSPWVKRFANLIQNGPILDLAAGSGRHSNFFLNRGYSVTAIDLVTTELNKLENHHNCEILLANLETKNSVFAKGGCLHNRRFSGIVVTNYLHRPLMKDLVNALLPDGVLIYETFALGNELFSRPRNPKHLLKCGELINIFHKKLKIIAYEHGKTENTEIPGVKQRIVAINDLGNKSKPNKKLKLYSIDEN